MCTPSSPRPAPPPLPVQAPPPMPVLDTAQGNTTTAALASNRGRSGLRIDRTQNVAGGAGNGLNIPS